MCNLPIFGPAASIGVMHLKNDKPARSCGVGTSLKTGGKLVGSLLVSAKTKAAIDSVHDKPLARPALSSV